VVPPEFRYKSGTQRSVTGAPALPYFLSRRKLKADLRKLTPETHSNRFLSEGVKSFLLLPIAAFNSHIIPITIIICQIYFLKSKFKNL